MIPEKEERICFVKDCWKKINFQAIIHDHTANDKCDPYDDSKHNYLELCKEHYKEMHRKGEKNLVLKDEYYD